MKNIIITIIAVASLATIFFGTNYSSKELYGNTGEVIQIYDNCMTIKDRTGNVWVWNDVEDWAVGDKLVMTVYDCGTLTAKDDKIIKLTYVG